MSDHENTRKFAQSAIKLYLIQDKRIPLWLTQAKQRGTLSQKYRQQLLLELGFPNEAALNEAVSQIDYFETSQIENLKSLGHASMILRSYWEKPAQALSKAMPEDEHRMKPVTVNAFENDDNEYGRTIFPSQLHLCNLLAGLYLMDKEQPQEKQVLQQSKALEFIADAMKKRDWPLPFTAGLKVRVEEAMKDVMDISSEVEKKLEDPKGLMTRFGVFSAKTKDRIEKKEGRGK